MVVNKAVVIIPFVRMPASQNPNLRRTVGVDSASPYYQSMIVAFASIKRFNPHVGMALVTNEPPPEPYLSMLTDLGVEVRRVSFGHRPPDGFASTFVGSLYLLDALARPESVTRVLIDPDVLCIRSLDRMLDDVSSDIGALNINLGPDENINGISRRDAGIIHGLLGEPELTPVHYGGEVYILPPGNLIKLKERCDAAWIFSLRRHGQAQTKFSTEEHILSYAVRAFEVKELSAFARRIWTAHKYRNVIGDEKSLTL